MSGNWTALSIALTKKERDEVMLAAVNENLTASAYVRKKLGLTYDKGRKRHKNWMKKHFEHKELYNQGHFKEECEDG